MKKSLARTVLITACSAATLAVGILAHSGQTARSAEDNVGTAVGTPGVLLAAPALTAVQLETVLDRASLALTIVDRVAPEAKARGLNAGWRQSMIEALLTLGEDRLRRIEKDAATLDVVSETLATTPDDPTTLGDPLTDFTFTPRHQPFSTASSGRRSASKMCPSRLRPKRLTIQASFRG